MFCWTTYSNLLQDFEVANFHKSFARVERVALLWLSWAPMLRSVPFQAFWAVDLKSSKAEHILVEEMKNGKFIAWKVKRQPMTVSWVWWQWTGISWYIPNLCCATLHVDLCIVEKVSMLIVLAKMFSKQLPKWARIWRFIMYQDDDNKSVHPFAGGDDNGGFKILLVKRNIRKYRRRAAMKVIPFHPHGLHHMHLIRLPTHNACYHINR